MLKEKARGLLKPLVENDLGWQLLKPLAKLGRFFHEKRDEIEAKRTHDPEAVHAILPQTILSVLKNKKVLYGPFTSMIYPSLNSVLSAIYPKILGSYEKELHPVIEAYCLNNYTEIIDIGCAEGYYAVGLGLRIKAAQVFAYDTNETARNLCTQMAALNGIGHRLHMKTFCSAEELKSFKFTGRGLIICDCEGYEKTLFNEQNIRNLTKCDILIEAHDFIDINISDYLTQLFSATHQILIIKSIDDIEKARTYTYKETADLDLATRYNLFREGRPTIMEWLVCTPKV